MTQQGPTDKEIELNRINILSIAEGFFHSSVLFALLKLRIFERIGDKGKTLNQLAEELNANSETLARLLNAGVVLKLLESKDGMNYKVSSASQTLLLPSAGENYLGSWIRNMDFFRDALSRLDEAILTSGPTVDPDTHVGADKDQTHEFAMAMHNYAFSRGKELSEFLDTSTCSRVLDLGSGPGTYSFHLGMNNPGLKLYMLDRPEVLDVAKEIQKKYSIENEVHYLPQDALNDKIPGSYDLILVSNTLHMIGEQGSRELVKRLYPSVNPGGSLVIQANFMRDDRMGERWPVFVDLVQLCTTSAGKNHSVSEKKKWMEDAGFKNIEYNRMTFFKNNSFIRGYKAE